MRINREPFSFFFFFFVTNSIRRMFGKLNPAISFQRIPAASVNLAGKRIAVVGGTDGLGRAIARLVAARGGSVTVVGRTFRDEGAPNVAFMKHDLASMAEAASLAASLHAQELDSIVFTTGILAPSKRVATPEGIELDMAVSALSRAVILKAVAPRLKSGCRVFIVGFPGSGQKGNLDDINSEKSYAGGLGQAHVNTVVVNEALVYHYKDKLAAQGVSVFGLNPGLIATDIRKPMTGGGLLGGIFETVIGLFNVTPDRYAENIIPLFVAPELAAHSGALFNQGGAPILPSAAFLADPMYTARVMERVDELEAKAAAAHLK